MALQADYVVNNSRRELFQRNINLTYNPATGVNYVSTDATRAVYPDWGVVNAYLSEGWSNFHALETAFTKRLSDRWQASATYTLSGLLNLDSQPFSGLSPVPFTVAPDLGGEWGYSADDQRHRAVFSGIWQVGHGFQVSGLHYFGAGIRLASNFGGDLRNISATTGSARLRPDGTIVPRNSLLAPAQNRTDVRLQQRIKLTSRVAFDGLVDVFNVFNRPNFGIGTQESTVSQYLQNISAQTRTAQFGFRLTF
jgi:hypothetical protein